MAIRVHGLPPTRAHRAIDAAFREIARVHARMSFHEAGSDVSRLNREAARRPVAVDPRTIDVLRWARRIAELSHGSFDVTVAAELVRWGRLPRPDGAPGPDPRGSWRDIELLPQGRVHFHRPVWIDLGGIAKGYAVDRAVERLRRWGAPHCCVNAGGDLRVRGPGTERILLGGPRASAPLLAVLELEEGSVASSSRLAADPQPDRGPHVHGRRRGPVGARSFVSVVADRCLVADALTKVVLAEEAASEELLRSFGASAHLHRPGHGWRTLGGRS